MAESHGAVQDRHIRLFAEMARELLAQDTVEDVLQRICELAVDTVQGCEAAGVMLLDRRRHLLDTPAATHEFVRASDRAQVECDEGPCLDAARHEQSFRVDDMAAEDRWPRYRPRAVELGIGSMLGFELYTHDATLSALAGPSPPTPWWPSPPPSAWPRCARATRPARRSARRWGSSWNAAGSPATSVRAAADRLQQHQHQAARGRPLGRPHRGAPRRLAPRAAATAPAGGRAGRAPPGPSAPRRRAAPWRPRARRSARPPRRSGRRRARPPRPRGAC